MKKKTPSHQNFYKFCTTPWTYCSEYEPKASIVWWVAQVHCLYIEDEDWLVCFDCDALEMKKKTPSHQNFYKFCTTPGTYCSEYEPKSLYCLMGCTGSLFIHRGWRLAGLFRLWCPGNEKKTPSHQNSYKFCTTPGTYCSEYDPKSLYWSMGCTGSLFIHRGWRLAGLFRLWRPGNEKRLLRTRIFTSSAPRPGRIVPSTNQKASIDRWVAQVHCLYIEDEDWLVCFDCDALEMKKKTPSHQNFYKFCTTPGTYCSEYDPKSLYWSMGCTSSLLIHRGWRLAGLFRLWCPGNEKKKTPSHQNSYMFCTTPWTYCSEYEPKSLYCLMGCTGSLFIHRGWRLAGLLRLWRAGNEKEDSFAPEFLQVLHHALDVLFRVRTKSLYCLMGCTGSLFIHRGWRLAGLFRLWRPGNEKKKTPSHQNFYKFCTTPGTYCSEYDPKSLYWSMGCTSSLLIHRGWRLAGLFRLWCPGNEKKRLLRTRILTSSAPRPGRIVPSTNQKASIVWWVAQVHCLYIEDEDWLVCYDCDALEMKKKTPSHQNFYKFCTTPWTYCSEYEPKASIVWWVAQVHCLYIEDEDWLVCFDCDALEMKKKDSFAPEFLQVLHHARDVLFRVRPKKPLLIDGLHKFIVDT